MDYIILALFRAMANAHAILRSAQLRAEVAQYKSEAATHRQDSDAIRERIQNLLNNRMEK